ncbi:MAG: hypothetical protein WD032_11970 [Nitrospirales bacterium]
MVYASLLEDYNDRNELVLELVSLHNEGLIDIVGAFASLKNNLPNGPDFFLTRLVFEEALPALEASVPSVLGCVVQLYKGAGQDLAAGTIIDGFIAFCEKDSSRSREVLAEIEACPDDFIDLLPATLIAGSRIDHPFYLSQVIRLSEDENVELRRGAIFSIGRLNWPDGIMGCDSGFSVLERCIAVETDDHILGNIVKSAFALLQRDTTQVPRAVELIVASLAKGGEYSLHAGSSLFALNTSNLPPTLLDALLVHLARLKTPNNGILDNIDYGISNLLKKDDPEKAIQLLEALLLANPNDLSMEVFKSTVGYILRNKALISKILTRWFLRGDRALCNAVHAIIGMHHGKDFLLEIDSSELEPADLVHMVFVARKAIGYLFMQPTSAASVLISLMRHTTDDKVLASLGELLFDPLLLNFTGKVREYVQQQSCLESGKVEVTIAQSLKAIDVYLEDLRAVGNLAALHPGEGQRETHNRHFSRLMMESMKAAEDQSILLKLVSKSVILYGKKSIFYVYGSDGQSHRKEMTLQCHSTEMEVPRMENLDPFGLDYMLRHFRNEQFKA